MKLTDDQRTFAAHILGVFGGRLWLAEHPHEAVDATPATEEEMKARAASVETPVALSQAEQIRRQFALEILNGDWPKDDSVEGWNR